MRNEELLRKADITIGDLSSYGKLNPEQANAFIRKLSVESTVLNAARKITMTAPQRKVNKIGFGARVMHPGVSATALGAGDRSKVDISGVTLTTKEGMAEVHIPYDVIEDAIENGNINIGGANTDPDPVQGGIKDAIMDVLGRRVAVDLEDVALNGDSGSGDTWLAHWEGWLKLMTSNVVNYGSQPISRKLFKNGLQTMPDEYLQNRAGLANYVSVDQETEYRDNFAGRETARGDAVAEGLTDISAFGSGIRAASLMPDATGFLCNPQNLLWGVQRDISIEVDKDIRARNFIIVLSLRCDFAIEEEEATVKYTNIGAVT